MLKILLHNIKVRSKKWWNKHDTGDKIAIIVGTIALIYFVLCWGNIVLHNQDMGGHEFPKWNFIVTLFK